MLRGTPIFAENWTGLGTIDRRPEQAKIRNSTASSPGSPGVEKTGVYNRDDYETKIELSRALYAVPGAPVTSNRKARVKQSKQNALSPRPHLV